MSSGIFLITALAVLIPVGTLCIIALIGAVGGGELHKRCMAVMEILASLIVALVRRNDEPAVKVGKGRHNHQVKGKRPAIGGD